MVSYYRCGGIISIQQPVFGMIISRRAAAVVANQLSVVG